MNANKIILRKRIPSDNDALRKVFYLSVHELASDFYTPKQLNAWAPKIYDKTKWAQKMAALNPFVALVGGKIAGYGDLQDSGLIDHFFVAPKFARQYVGQTLIERICQDANRRKIKALHAHVSLAAVGFFEKYGFLPVASQEVFIGQIALKNTLMSKTL